MTSVTQAQ